MAMGNLPGQGADEGDGDEGDGGVFAEINITPLTDVFLVLVIIFMIAAFAVQKEADKAQEALIEQTEREQKSGLKVTLPAGAAQELSPADASITITIALSGAVMVGQQVVADAELDAMLQAAYVKDVTTQVVLLADKGVPHGRVVGLMERAKAVGLTRLAIATSPN